MKLFFENNSAGNVALGAGYIMAGFGGGQFKHIKRVDDKPGPIEPSKMLLFSLKDHTSFVMYNGKMQAVGSILATRRSTHPTATFCYHEIVENEEKAQEFSLKRKNDIYFCPGKAKVETEEGGGEPGPAGKTAAALLAAFPVDKLLARVGDDGAPCCIAWSVRWTLNRLMPIKPHLVLSSSAEVPAGKCFEL